MDYSLQEKKLQQIDEHPLMPEELDDVKLMEKPKQKPADTATEVSRITSFIELGTFKVGDSMESKSQMAAKQWEEKTELLLEDEKTSGDSPEMKDVKDNLKKLKQILTRDRERPLTENDCDYISEMYEAAMMSCQYYCDVKNPWFTTGKRRKAKVQATLDRLKKEAAAIAMGKMAIKQGGEETKDITSGVMLLSLGALSTYMEFNTAKSKKPDEKEQLNSDLREKELLYEEQKDKLDREYQQAKDKAEEKYKDLGDLMKKFRVAGDLELMAAKKKYNAGRLTLDAQKTDIEETKKKLDEFDEKRKEKVAQKRQDAKENAEDNLRNFPGYLQKVAHILMDGNMPSASFKDKKKLTAEEKETVSGLVNLMYNLSDFKPGTAMAKTIGYGGGFVTFVQDEMGNLSMESGGVTVPLAYSGAELSTVISRDVIYNPTIYGDTVASSVISAQKTDLSQMTRGELLNSREFSIEVLFQKTGIPKTLMNNVPVDELKRLALEALDKATQKGIFKTVVKEKVDYYNTRRKEDSVNTTLNLELQRVGIEMPQGVIMHLEKKHEDSGLEPQEEQLRDLVADLIFSEDTVQTDELKDKPGERLRATLIKHKDIISTIVSDLFESEAQKKDSIVEKLVSKLPVSMMGLDEGGEVIKNAVNTIRNKILETILGEEEAKDVVKSGFAKMALKQKNTVLSKLDKAITDMDDETLAGMEADINGMVDDTMAGVQEAFGKHVDTIFSKGKKAEADGEDPQVNNAGQMEGTHEEIRQKRMADTRARIAKNKAELEEKLAPYKAQKAEQKAIMKANEKERTSEEWKKYDDAEKKVNELDDKIREIRHATGDSLVKLIKDNATGKSGQGLFMKKVLGSYFGSVSVMDKRSMLAGAIRNCKAMKGPAPKLEDGEPSSEDQLNMMSDVLGGMFKGAGPLLQKMLQGLPADDFPEGLKKAIEDTQDNLSSIPEQIVKGHMDGIIQRSDGKISSIEVKRSLGAASVGQAFLCTVYGPGMEKGKDVVVKILRPDVRNRMMREKEVMLNAARLTDREGKSQAEIEDMEQKHQIGGMEATYLGNLSRIEEELDLTIEAKNCEKGAIYDKELKGQTENLANSMKMSNLTEATSDTCMMELAGKKTLKRYLSDINENVAEKLKKFCIVETVVVKDKKGKEKTVERLVKNDDGSYKLKNDLSDDEKKELKGILNEFKTILSDVEQRQKGMLQLSQKWVTEGIYEKGYYHGDLHAGNIMVGEKGVTAIDFGNATEITSFQQKHVTIMMTAAMMGDAKLFRHSFHMLLEKTPEEVYQAKKEELTLLFEEVMSLGDEASTGERIAAALLKAQELGLELPPVIANFSSCQMRLSNAVTSINNTMMDLRKNVIMLEGADLEKRYTAREQHTNPLVPIISNIRTVAKQSPRAAADALDGIIKARVEVAGDEKSKKKVESSKNELKTHVAQFLPKKGRSDINKDETPEKYDKRYEGRIEMDIETCIKCVEGDTENKDIVRALGEDLKARARLCLKLENESEETRDQAAYNQAYAEMNKVYEQFCDFLFKGTITVLKNLKEEVSSTKPLSKNFEPGNFLSVMVDVIRNYKKATLTRIGLLTTLKVKKMMDSED